MATCGDKFPFISADWFGPALGNNPNGPCSGNGICNNVTGLCECFEGWTGLSDLINTVGLDCQINNLVIQLEWGFVVLLACLFMFQTRDSVVDRIRQHYEIKAQRLSQGKQYRVWKNNRTLIAMLLYSFGTFPSIFILGILRIADPNERAGVTFGYSILFFTGKLSFYTAALIFQPALLGSLLSGGKSNKIKIARMIRLGYVSQYVTFTLSIVAAVAPLIIIADPSKGVTEIAQIVYIAYFVLQAVSMIILFSVSYTIKKRAGEIFSQSYSLTQDKRTKELGEKVNDLQKKALISSSLIGAIYIAYVIFPTLWNKHDYVFPLTWLPFVVIGKSINRQHVKTHGSSSKGTGGGDSSYSEGQSKTNNRSFRTIFRGKQGGSSNYIVPQGQKEAETIVPTKDDDDGYV